MKGLIPGHSAQKPRYMSLSPLCFLYGFWCLLTHRLPRLPGTLLCSGLSALSCGPPVTTANGWSPLAMVSIKQPWLLSETFSRILEPSHMTIGQLTPQLIPLFLGSTPWFSWKEWGEAQMEPQEFPAILSRYLTCSYGCPSYKNKLLR